MTTRQCAAGAHHFALALRELHVDDAVVGAADVHRKVLALLSPVHAPWQPMLDIACSRVLDAGNGLRPAGGRASMAARSARRGGFTHPEGTRSTMVGIISSELGSPRRPVRACAGGQGFSLGGWSHYS
jgi:hypothetical protein